MAWLQFRTTPYTLRHILCAIVLMIVALPAINLIGYINQQMTLPTFLQPLETWMKTQEENAALLAKNAELEEQTVQLATQTANNEELEKLWQSGEWNEQTLQDLKTAHYRTPYKQ